MIDLYTSDTPNGHRAQLMLEEVGVSYTTHQISLSKQENQSKEFLKLNPSARIPVIVDNAPEHAKNTQYKEQQPFVLTQSAAILIYLAEKTDKLLPTTDYPLARARTLEWLSFDATDIATTGFNAFYLSLHKLTKAKLLLKKRTMEYYAVYNKHLASSRFLAGDKYSIADVAAFPWAKASQDQFTNEYSHLQQWMQRIERRSAVRKIWSDVLQDKPHKNGDTL